LATGVVCWLVAASSRSAIGVMEPSEDRRRDDATVGVFGLTGASRDLLPEPLLGALAVEVVHVFRKDALQVTVAEDEGVVEALAADAAEEPLANGVHLGCPNGRENHPDENPRAW
jgi:hypothetical protein